MNKNHFLNLIHQFLGIQNQNSDKEKAASAAAFPVATYDGNRKQANQDLNPSEQLEPLDFTMNSIAVKSQVSIRTSAQEKRVLEHLKNNREIGLNRFEADTLLNVCHLAARINSLRNRGHIIRTIYENANDTNGRFHKKIARYVWCGQQRDSWQGRSYQQSSSDFSI